MSQQTTPVPVRPWQHRPWEAVAPPWQADNPAAVAAPPWHQWTAVAVVAPSLGFFAEMKAMRGIQFWAFFVEMKAT
jgi:hypothetical protein